MITIQYIEYLLNSYGGNIKSAPIRVHDLSWYQYITKKSDQHERLEYLGDSILGAVVGEYLFNRFQHEQEGFLTKLRTKIVRSDQLIKFAKMMQLDMHMDRPSQKNLEDAFEVLIGAIVQDQAPFGYETARRFIHGLLNTLDFDYLIENNDNYKGVLLNYYQSKGWQHPVYKEMTTCHYKKLFTYGVLLPKSLVQHDASFPIKRCIDDGSCLILGRGTGSTKKEAEQMCSKNALMLLNVQVSGI